MIESKANKNNLKIKIFSKENHLYNNGEFYKWKNGNYKIS